MYFLQVSIPLMQVSDPTSSERITEASQSMPPHHSSQQVESSQISNSNTNIVEIHEVQLNYDIKE